MTQVKTLHFDSTHNDLDFVKVTYKNGDVVLLDTDQRGDKASVLKDLDDGLFDEDFGYVDTLRDITKWDKAHPDAELIYGE